MQKISFNYDHHIYHDHPHDHPHDHLYLYHPDDDQQDCVQVAALCVQLQSQQSVFEERVEAARKEAKQVIILIVIIGIAIMVIIVTDLEKA